MLFNIIGVVLQKNNIWCCNWLLKIISNYYLSINQIFVLSFSLTCSIDIFFVFQISTPPSDVSQFTWKSAKIFKILYILKLLTEFLDFFLVFELLTMKVENIVNFRSNFGGTRKINHKKSMRKLKRMMCNFIKVLLLNISVKSELLYLNFWGRSSVLKSVNMAAILDCCHGNRVAKSIN